MQKGDTTLEQTRAAVSVLLIDDDTELCGMMGEFFAAAGWVLECAYNGRDGLARAVEGEHDLVLLDVMLPLIPGFTVLAQLRKRTNIPVIMLTTRVQPQDRVEGLDLGADDYLPKPFDPDELLARIRAVLRRSGDRGSSASLLRCDGVEVDVATRTALSGGRALDLTALEFDILELLMRSAGRIVSRDEIMASLFERLPSAYDRSLDVHISHLRKKLERGRALIQTVRGVGYLFAATERRP